MFQGRVVRVTPVAETTQQDLIKCMTGYSQTREAFID